MERRILILGGTSEARALAAELGKRDDLAITISLAGRTVSPASQPAPVHSGGFGGAEGLAAWLQENGIAAALDATHPYAARISANAVAACKEVGLPLVTLVRPEWSPVAGDRWRTFDTLGQAIAGLGKLPRRVFVTLGRQEVAALLDAPWHDYLIRSVDPIEPPLALPNARFLLDRGPFADADEEKLLRANKIEVILAKNSGGAATYGKIAAARRLGVEVFLLRRPPAPVGPVAETVEEALGILDHVLSASAVPRGE